MAVGSESSSSSQAAVEESKKRRRKDPGVRVIGGRIYDSENGKTCHQCRQKTMDLMASCKNPKEDKPCTMAFCHKCLLNRYGENAEEVGKLEVWNCPRCRGVCNCSFCMKRKGYRPTGCLAPTVKQIGFSSVHELLDHHKGSEDLNSTNVVEVPKVATNSFPSRQRQLLDSKRNCNTDNQYADEEENNDREANLHVKTRQNCDSEKLKFNPSAEIQGSVAGDANIKPQLKQSKSEKLHFEVHEESCKEDIVLPQGTPLLEVAGVELQPEYVGPALQFLEFCNSFIKVLHIKKGQPECILRELVKGRIGRRGTASPVVRFNIKLLSLIEENVKDDNWVQALGRCITNSQCPLDNLPEGTFERGLPGYDSLDQTEKLRILNFLCDEILETPDVRNWIDEEMARFDEETKETKEKVLALRKEEKLLKQKLKDDIAQALISRGAQLALSEHDHVISNIRTKVDKEHAKLLKTIEDLPKKKQRSEASGAEPILLEGSGRAYWKLRSFNNNSNIILQDVGTWEFGRGVDNWYSLDPEEEKAVENHISFARNPPKKQLKSTYTVSSDDVKVKTDSTTANLMQAMPLSCPALEKMDKVKAIMNMRASK